VNRETLKKIEAAASPAPWHPNSIYETEGDGAWGAGPLVEPTANDDREIQDRGDWTQEDQERLAMDDAALIATTRNLLPEMLALWEAVERIWEPPVYVRDALTALNAKLAIL
jgi:hypothetical protein